MVPTLHNITGFPPLNRRILHWAALCSLLFTNLHLWLVVLERHLWLFEGVACSRACALMFCILTFGFKGEVDWALEGWSSDSSFRWMRMREASQVSKQNPGKHNGTQQQSQQNNAWPECKKQNYRTTGAKLMSFWIFFFPLELLQSLLWTNGNGLKSKTNGEMLNFRHCFHGDSPFVARGKMFCCF